MVGHGGPETVKCGHIDIRRHPLDALDRRREEWMRTPSQQHQRQQPHAIPFQGVGRSTASPVHRPNTGRCVVPCARALLMQVNWRGIGHDVLAIEAQVSLSIDRLAIAC